MNQYMVTAIRADRFELTLIAIGEHSLNMVILSLKEPSHRNAQHMYQKIMAWPKGKPDESTIALVRVDGQWTEC